jgi:uncharacterized protein YbjT (DUF2867 family)
MKNYIITGSIGNISKPIVSGLVKAGKNVSVITSKTDKIKDIEQLGAKALVGSVSDKEFVKNAFAGPDVVYTMIPPIWQTSNWRASQNEVGDVYIDAIKSNNIKYVVNLSSLGAHLQNGVGPVGALYDFEQALNAVPGLNVKHLRPSFFYYNLLAQIGLIKNAGIMGANYGEHKIALAHPRDIAEVALQELLDLKFSGNSVRDIVSDERTGAEVAKTLGAAIGKDLPWVVFSDEDQLKGLLDGGVPKSHAPAYVEMGAALRNGKMQERISDNKTAGRTKLEDFAKEFSAAYNG